MNITWDDKNKNQIDSVHNLFRDIDANEVKTAVNSKMDRPNGIVSDCQIELRSVYL